MNSDTTQQLTADEIYRAIDLEKNLEITEAEQLVIKKDFENHRPAVERFVHKVVGSSSLGYGIKPNAKGLLAVKELTLGRQYFPLLKAYCQSFIPGYYFSPHVELFFQCCRHLGVGDWASLKPNEKLSSGLFVAEMFNCLLDELRKGVASDQFKRKLRTIEETCKRGFDSCRQYFNDLMTCRRRLLVLRVDFSYLKEHSANASPEEIAGDLKRFLDSRRYNPLFKSLFGYIWRLEYGEDKGLHYHMIFFLDGSKSQHDDWLAQQYGRHWQKCCASGQGIFFNCNRKKKSYCYLGIGMIKRDDYLKRYYFIRKVLSYLAKKDQYLLSKVTKNMRRWGHGGTPDQTNTVKLGRPRRGPIDLPKLSCSVD